VTEAIAEPGRIVRGVERCEHPYLEIRAKRVSDPSGREYRGAGRAGPTELPQPRGEGVVILGDANADADRPSRPNRGRPDDLDARNACLLRDRSLILRRAERVSPVLSDPKAPRKPEVAQGAVIEPRQGADALADERENQKALGVGNVGIGVRHVDPERGLTVGTRWYELISTPVAEQEREELRAELPPVELWGEVRRNESRVVGQEGNDGIRSPSS
jgi:hypothetical protein